MSVVLTIIVAIIVLIVLYEYDLAYKLKIKYYAYKAQKQGIKNYFITAPAFIYRYEKDGVGAFLHKETNKTFYKRIINTLNKNYHPSPIDDKKLKYMFAYLTKTKELDDYFFGCLSLEELYLWFNEEIRKELNQRGFKIEKYKTDCYIQGTNQVLFKKNYNFMHKEIKEIL